MKRFNIAALIGAGAVAAGLALGATPTAHAVFDEVGFRGFADCLGQHTPPGGGPVDDVTIETCCVLHNGTFHQDAFGATCEFGVDEVDGRGNTPTSPTKNPVRPGKVDLPPVLAPSAAPSIPSSKLS